MNEELLDADEVAMTEDKYVSDSLACDGLELT